MKKKKITVFGGNKQLSVDPAISDLMKSLMDAWIDVDGLFNNKRKLVSLLFKKIEDFNKFMFVLHNFNPELCILEKIPQSFNFNSKTEPNDIWNLCLIPVYVYEGIAMSVELRFPLRYVNQIIESMKGFAEDKDEPCPHCVAQTNHDIDPDFVKELEKYQDSSQIECDWLKDVCDEIQKGSNIPKNRIFKNPNNN